MSSKSRHRPGQHRDMHTLGTYLYMQPVCTLQNCVSLALQHEQMHTSCVSCSHEHHPDCAHLHRCSAVRQDRKAHAMRRPFSPSLRPISDVYASFCCKGCLDLQIMKPVTFPNILDTYEFCSEELQKVLAIPRAKVRGAHMMNVTLLKMRWLQRALCGTGRRIGLCLEAHVLVGV